MNFSIHRLHVYIIAFFIAFLLYVNSFAQDYNFRFDKITSENIKIEKGLSVNSVNCIAQDNTGYMWFGTWDGLNKFDGYNFTVYKANDLGKDDDLSNQTVHSLFLDKEGNLWVGTEGGLNEFLGSKQSFVQFKHKPGDKTSLSNDTVWSVFEDSNNNLWVGTQNGLNLLDKLSGKVTQFFPNPANNNSISNNRIFDIFEDKMGYVWFATEKGLNKYNLLNKKFTRYYHDPSNVNSISSDTIRAGGCDKEGFIWVGTENGLCKIDPEKGTVIRYQYNPKDKNSISSNHISEVFIDSKGALWIGTNGRGFDIFDKKNNSFTRFLNVSNSDNSLNNNNVSYIYEDKSGIIWISTEKGLNKIDRNSYKFVHYQHIQNNDNSLNNNLVWSFLEDKNSNVWIGTDEGIAIYDKKTDKFNLLKNNFANKNLSAIHVKAMIIDNIGNAWIGTEGYGLGEFSITGTGLHKKLSLIKILNNKNGLCDNTIWCLLEDKKGNIWIGTNNGLNRYDKNNGELKSFKNNLYNPFGISNNVINALYEDNAGIIWIGTYNGLDRFDYVSQKIYTYKHITKNLQSLSSNRIFGIYQDASGIIWLGTMGGGLNRLDSKTGIIKHYTEKDGLANNMVYSILEDKSRNLWLSTNSGISKFDIKTQTFINYDVKDGVQSSEFNQNAALKTKDGEFFLGGMNGFNAFYPEDIIQNKYIPRIVITSFKKYNEVQKTEINNEDTIVLSYNDNFFSFEFSALDYSNPSKNKYAYKLEHFDKDWIYCDANKRFAEYTKVSPGVYRFRVKGTNCDGIWNEKGISVTIIIYPPWWATWAFRIPFIFFIIFAGWFIITRRFRQLRKKHEMEKKVLEIEKQVFDLEQKALQLQMNPHFIFNSLNSIQSFIINNDSDKASLYLAKFAQLMRLILANSREQFVPVKDEIKVLTYYMDIENLRFDNKFDYKITVDPEIDDDFVGIPPMIIQPYVENAILHGIIHKTGRGNISIILSLHTDNILCVIEDDGVGREKAMEIKNNSGLKHKSRGMIITKERLEIMNKQIKGRISVNVIDLKDEYGTANGTKVEIIIPFKEI
jgi:two-component system sensor histidine kinase ChiS